MLKSISTFFSLYLVLAFFLCQYSKFSSCLKAKLNHPEKFNKNLTKLLYPANIPHINHYFYDNLFSLIPQILQQRIKIIQKFKGNF